MPKKTTAKDKKRELFDTKPGSQRFYDACADRLAYYLRVSDRANVTYKCLDPKAQEDGEADPPAVQVEGDKVIVRIDGPLDWFWGLDVGELVRDLDKADPSIIDVRLNSPGGLLFDGLYLYNDLRKRAEDSDVQVSAVVQGLAASAAVLPFLAADERSMQTGSLLATHKPYTWTFLMGNEDELDAQFAAIKKGLVASTKAMLGVYADRLDRSQTDIESFFDEERWLTPEEARDEGFVNDEPPADASEDTDGNDTDTEDKYKAQAQKMMEEYRLGRLKDRVAALKSGNR